MSDRIENTKSGSLDEILGGELIVTNAVEWRGVEFIIKQTLSIGEMLEFVNDVVTGCFQENGGFLPEVADFAIKLGILNKYTTLELPGELERCYEIVYCTDLVEFVSGYINTEQLGEITASINRKISYLCNTNVMNIRGQIMELLTSFETIQQRTTDMFQDLTPDDMKNVIGALENSRLSEEKLVEAYLNKTRKQKKKAGV